MHFPVLVLSSELIIGLLFRIVVGSITDMHSFNSNVTSVRVNILNVISVIGKN